ncbi:hypothetical protein PR048_018645 [Dryococelus australis]|uniref:DDE-1 domain-containing protein n=1 Tax=Dryococelus australis TaxID=614101 RepID=A0ABQ9HD25_9NEOP|nr:hypothetical protein PR048_018645 [Dryococelus australis]
MDQGVIINFKHFYRWLVVENILTTNEDKKVKIDLQASRMCNRAWEKVKNVTIADCFKKLGFTQRRNQNDIRGQNLGVNDEEVMPAVEGFGDLMFSSVLYEEFVTMDDDIVVCGE